MIGVHVEAAAPIERGYGGPGFGENVARLGACQGVLAVRLVPDGGHLDADGGGIGDGLELGFTLPGKAVAHAKGILFDLFEDLHADMV